MPGPVDPKSEKGAGCAPLCSIGSGQCKAGRHHLCPVSSRVPARNASTQMPGSNSASAMPIRLERSGCAICGACRSSGNEREKAGIDAIAKRLCGRYSKRPCSALLPQVKRESAPHPTLISSVNVTLTNSVICITLAADEADEFVAGCCAVAPWPS